MAFAKGNQSTEGAVRKFYCGVASSYVLAVNPTKAEQEKLFNTTLEKEPEYVTKTEEGKDMVRISFVLKVDSDKYKNADGSPVELVTNHAFFLRNEPRKGSNSGKYQIVDAYGNFAWATEEEIKNKQIPQYANGPANIHEGYRMAYSGEEELTEFLKKYLVIPNSVKWANGKPCGWVDNLQDCECRLDNIAEYFKGNFKELKEIVALQPNNKVKLAYGVKTDSEGKQRQATFTRMTLSNVVTNYDKLSEALKQVSAVDYTGDNNQSNVRDLMEYVVTATDFSTASNATLPTDNSPFPFA